MSRSGSSRWRSLIELFGVGVGASGGAGRRRLWGHHRVPAGLEQRELEYVVQVKGVTSAQPAEAVPGRASSITGRGRPHPARYPESLSSLRDLVLAAGREQVRTARLARGRPRPAGQPVHRARVRPANDAQRDDDGVLPERWLLAEWPAEKDEPVKYWLSTCRPRRRS